MLAWPSSRDLRRFGRSNEDATLDVLVPPVALKLVEGLGWESLPEELTQANIDEAEEESGTEEEDEED
jgi:hypothetical protein